MIKIWRKDEENNFYLTKSWEGHAAIILDLCLLPKGYIASAGGDAEIRIFDIATNQQQGILLGHSDWVWQLIPMGLLGLFSCSEDGTIRYWIWKEASCAFILDNVCPTHAIAYDKALQLLFAGDIKGQLSMWDINKKRLRHRFVAHDGLIRSIIILPNGNIATAGEDGFLRVWKSETFFLIYEHQRPNFVQDLCWFQGRLFSAAYDGEIIAHIF